MTKRWLLTCTWLMAAAAISGCASGTRQPVSVGPLLVLEKTIPLPLVNVAMALDDDRHRVFIGCDPGRFVVIDTHNGRAVFDASIPAHPNCVGFDEKRGLIYVSCGSGSIEIIKQLSADRYVLTSNIETPSGSLTSLFSNQLDRLYLAVPQGTDHPAQVRVYRPSSPLP